MPELRNHKQELFARFLADGNSQSQSYELAGYRPSTANASTLANRPDVQARVEELKEQKLQAKADLHARLIQIGVDPTDTDEFAAKTEEVVLWTVAKVQHELFQNARLAQAAGEFGAANKALELLGQSVGMWDKAKKEKDDGSSRPQVSIALIGEATDRLAISSGGESAEVISPLRPRVGSTGDAERIAGPRSADEGARRS